jgi:cell division protein FtsN
MTDGHAAVGLDRLPWLDDEPAPRAEPKLRPAKPARGKAGPRELAVWAIATALLLAGGSYWLGMQSGQRTAGDAFELPVASRPEATAKLPEVRTAPEAAIPLVEAPEVRPVPAPQVRVPIPRTERSLRVRKRTLKPMEMKGSDLSKTVAEQEGGTADAEPAKPEAEQAATVKAAPAPTPAVRPLASRQQLKYWPARQSSGAAGKLVQIGAFGSRQQAKLGWRRMKRAYPAVGRLQAVVVEARNSRGKRFYRFQIGTTSQAHSEVLCQRMQRIRFSCAVVGLPWKSKVER